MKMTKTPGGDLQLTFAKRRIFLTPVLGSLPLALPVYDMCVLSPFVLRFVAAGGSAHQTAHNFPALSLCQHRQAACWCGRCWAGSSPLAPLSRVSSLVVRTTFYSVAVNGVSVMGRHHLWRTLWSYLQQGDTYLRFLGMY